MCNYQNSLCIHTPLGCQQYLQIINGSLKILRLLQPRHLQQMLNELGILSGLGRCDEAGLKGTHIALEEESISLHRGMSERLHESVVTSLCDGITQQLHCLQR